MSNFQPLEVAGRGSETQPQAVENLNKFSRISVINLPLCKNQKMNQCWLNAGAAS